MIENSNSGNFAGYDLRLITRNLKSIAHIFGIVFSPLLVPAYLFFILLVYFPSLTGILNINEKTSVMIGITLTTCLLPFILVYFLFKTKKIETFTLNSRKDRMVPQLFSCVNYLTITVYLAYIFGFSNLLTLAMMANTISLIFITLITPYWKISTHACGAFGLLSICTVLNLRHPSIDFISPYLIILSLTFAITASRLYLKVHTPLQIIAGAMLGGVVGFLLFFQYYS